MSETVKRYRQDETDPNVQFCDPTGEWVLYADHERLIAAAKREGVREAVGKLALGDICALCDNLVELWLGHDWTEAEARAVLLNALAKEGK